ncbi:hypothetical protein ACLEE6_01440 [Lonsdalea quercina]|uniref:hypothetical protein n=1 Tax=Lonsdalea quercina TaxID=71657 RepID=UPI0039756B88
MNTQLAPSWLIPSGVGKASARVSTRWLQSSDWTLADGIKVSSFLAMILHILLWQSRHTACFSFDSTMFVSDENLINIHSGGYLFINLREVQIELLRACAGEKSDLS